MPITNRQAWIADGRKAIPAQPIRDLALTLHGHGYNVGRLDIIGLGDDRHLQAATPEDHTPYSHTPWPGTQPYPAILAVDVMEPVPAGMPSLVALGEKILADKQAGRPELAWLKYMNRGLANGRAVHESWKPGHTTSPTTDKGHLHLSGRTDFVRSTAAARYDPVAELLGGDDMAIDPTAFSDLVYNADAILRGVDNTHHSSGKPVVNKFAAKLNDLAVDVGLLKQSMAAIKLTGTNAGDAAILEQVHNLATELADIRVKVGQRDQKIANLQRTVDLLRTKLAEAAASALSIESEGTAAA